MTTYNFSESARVANPFAIKLLAGTLNFYHDFDDPDLPFREVTREESGFSTSVIPWLRKATCYYAMSKLVLTDVVENRNTLAPAGRIRSATVFALDVQGKEKQVVTFDISQDYLDGDEVSGWTSWKVSNVVVTLGARQITLISEQYKGGVYLSDLIWGSKEQFTA